MTLKVLKLHYTLKLEHTKIIHSTNIIIAGLSAISGLDYWTGLNLASFTGLHRKEVKWEVRPGIEARLDWTLT